MSNDYATRIDWRFIRGQESDWSVGYVPNVKNRRGVVRSGTTILFGFDLGQHDPAELKSLRLSAALIAKLTPYLGEKGTDAVMAPQRRLEEALDKLTALNNQQTGSKVGSVGRMATVGVVDNPDTPARRGQTPRQYVASSSTVLRLELSANERTELTKAIQSHFYGQLQTHYDARRRGRRFSDLPVGIQTALLSLSWQTGSIWSRHHAAHSLFDAALQEDWSTVISKLSGNPHLGARVRPDVARRAAEGNLIRAAIEIKPASPVRPDVRAAPTVIRTVTP